MAKKEKQSVLVPYEFRNVFQVLIEKGDTLAAAELIIAIIDYDKDGTEPTFTNIGVDYLWESVIRPKLDKNKTAYQQVCEKRAEAVNQRYKSNFSSEKHTKVTNEYKSNFSSEKHTKVTNEYKSNFSSENATNATDNDNDYDTDIDNDNDIDNKPPISPFETFWKVYPKKKGKGEARKAFAKALKKTTVEALVEAVNKQKQQTQWTRDAGQFVPYPATWLNQERWEDEVDGNGSGTGHSEEPGLQRLADWEQQHTF